MRGGLLVEDDGPGAAVEKEEKFSGSFSFLFAADRKFDTSIVVVLLARWKLIAILVASGGSDAQEGGDEWGKKSQEHRENGRGEMSGIRQKVRRRTNRPPDGNLDGNQMK